MNVKTCRPYHAVLDSVETLTMLDGKSAFKIHYVSVVGRDQPERYEWDRSTITKSDFATAYRGLGLNGVGFVTAFPHITKVFRFSPHMETVLDVAVFDTAGLTPRSCDRGDGFLEFACYAEAVIAAEEYHAWAKSETVEDYLKCVTEAKDFPVRSNHKMGGYFDPKS